MRSLVVYRSTYVSVCSIYRGTHVVYIVTGSRMCYLVSITVFDGDGKVLEAACRTYVCVCVYVCVVSVTVKRPVLPPCVVNGRSRNPLLLSLLLFDFEFVRNFACVCVCMSGTIFSSSFSVCVWLAVSCCLSSSRCFSIFIYICL